MSEPSLALIGRSLAHYRVMEKIGAGGMGEVYLAHDSHLNRPVALKVLRPEVMADRDRKRRLVQEARSASSLNHTNIVTIYDISQADGTDYIAMEYVAGKNLAQLIGERRLTLEATLSYSLQIARALARAHKAGIVHRDLKPANIMITDEGLVKILDFGLAKLACTPIPVGEMPTQTNAPKPQDISFAGTPAYMSPEQLLGKDLDERSDIFAMGIVIFQCLTGRLPFENTPSHPYQANLLWGQPLALHLLAPEAPVVLERIVRRCLEKDPADRFSNAESLADELQKVPPTPQLLQDAEETTRRPPRLIMRRFALAAAILLICAAAIISVWFLRKKPEAGTAARTPTKMTPVITWSSDEFGGRISPDEKFISFISNRGGKNEVWLHSLAGGDPRSLSPGEGSVLSQAWSPSGNEIVWLVLTGDSIYLQIVPAPFGGAPRVTRDVNKSCRRLSRWIGDSIYIEGRETIYRFDLKAGQVQEVFTRADRQSKDKRYFDVRRDERKIAYTAYAEGKEDLWIADLQGGNPERLTSDAASDTYPLWIQATGPDIIFQSSRSGQPNLYQISTRTRAVQGISLSSGAQTPDDISRDGSTLILTEMKDSANLWSLDSATGAARQLTTDSLSDFWTTCAADAGVIAFQRRLPSATTGYDIFESQILSGRWDSGKILEPRLLVDNGFAPRLSRSGQWLAYSKWITTDNSYYELWAVETRGQRHFRIAERCPISGVSSFPLDFLSSDYAWGPVQDELYFIAQEPRGQNQIRRFLPRSPQAAPEAIVSAPATDRLSEIRLSRDGRRLSYIQENTGEQGRLELHLRDLISGEDRKVYVTGAGDRTYLFSRGHLDDKGNVLVLAATDNPDLTQDVKILEAGTSGTARDLAHVKQAFGSTAQFDPDTRTLYLTMVEENVHNIYAFSVADRKFRKITDNSLPRVTFSGLEVLPGRSLLYSRHEKQGDIWMMRFNVP